MRTARLVIKRESRYYDIRLYCTTYNSDYTDYITSELIYPRSYNSLGWLTELIRREHLDILSSSDSLDGIFLRYGFRKISSGSKLKEEIYPSEFTNRHRLTTKLIIHYAWRNTIKKTTRLIRSANTSIASVVNRCTKYFKRGVR